MPWIKIAKEETELLGVISGFDVEKFVATGERVEGARLELHIGVKDFDKYYHHLRDLYNKKVSMDDIVDDKARQRLHDKAAESVFKNSFSRAVLDHYKNNGGGLEGLNYRIRTMINDEVAEMMKFSVGAKFKGWVKFAFEGDFTNHEDGTQDVDSSPSFKVDKEGEGSDQYFSFKRNRNKGDTGEKNDDKSPIITQEDGIRKENQPGVDDYANSRTM